MSTLFSTVNSYGDPLFLSTGMAHSWSWREVRVSHAPHTKTSNYMCCLPLHRRHSLLLAPNAKNTGNSRKRPWWYNFFSDNDDEIWSGWSSEDVLSGDADGTNGKEETSEVEKFESWKRKVEAISELREVQEAATSTEGRQWEDWLGGDLSSSTATSSWDGDNNTQQEEPQLEISDDPYRVTSGSGLPRSIRNFILGFNDDDDNDDVDELLFEDRVFRYVKIVPLAAEMLDVRKHQKLEMVKILKLKRARFQLEVEIGKSPPLSDEEIWLELRHEAIELREDLRLENRRAFANIWSDMVYGISLFLLIYSNKSKVALLKFTGYKLLNNISDTGKAFIIILITDIFLGYHSESGWQAIVEIILEHYGLEVDPAAITIFICSVPVVIDACVKLWLFKFLPRLSPNVANIFREMKRH